MFSFIEIVLAFIVRLTTVIAFAILLLCINYKIADPGSNVAGSPELLPSNLNTENVKLSKLFLITMSHKMTMDFLGCEMYIYQQPLCSQIGVPGVFLVIIKYSRESKARNFKLTNFM